MITIIKTLVTEMKRLIRLMHLSSESMRISIKALPPSKPNEKVEKYKDDDENDPMKSFLSLFRP